MFEGLFQPMHLLIILAIALIIFGPGKLPELGAGIGKAIREFKKAMADAEKASVEKPAVDAEAAKEAIEKDDTVDQSRSETKEEKSVIQS